MKIAERIVIVLLLLAIFGGGVWVYFTIKHQQQEVRDAVARGEYEIPIEDKDTSSSTDQSNWRVYFPVTVPLTIGSTTVRASVADSLDERIKGLSETPYLPEGLVKLFVFGAEGPHSIWMKDMKYSIDIIWVKKSGEVVHIEENVTPESYPESFGSPTPAWYVIEANAGFVDESSIKIGDSIVVYLED